MVMVRLAAEVEREQPPREALKTSMRSRRGPKNAQAASSLDALKTKLSSRSME
jgi:hypothetical protein